MQLALADCFELGKALRLGDADVFCEVYDSIGNDCENFRFKVSGWAGRLVMVVMDERS